MSSRPNKPLTSQQQNVLNVIQDFVRQHGFSPTLREIGQALGLNNLNAVRGHLAALERKGCVTRAADKARSIQLVQAPSWLSQLKRKLHEVFQTDEGVLHRVIYGLAWATWQREPYLTPQLRDEMSKAIDREALEHGWAIVERRIEADHIVLVVITWPNHSAEQTVRRLQAAGQALQRRQPEAFPPGRLWDKGYAVTTDLELLDGLVAQLLGRQLASDPGDIPNQKDAGTTNADEQISPIRD